jgi:hypothetical protein
MIIDTTLLKNHLHKCQGNEEMTHFPTTKKEELSVRKIKKAQDIM